MSSHTTKCFGQNENRDREREREPTSSETTSLFKLFVLIVLLYFYWKVRCEKFGESGEKPRPDSGNDI